MRFLYTLLFTLALALPSALQAQAPEHLPEGADTGTPYSIVVDISEQQLWLYHNGSLQKAYICATSMYGPGNQRGYAKTPLGRHRISEKYGDGQPLGMVFKGRVPQGYIATIYTDATDSEDDLITSRILWLDGLEPGKNKGGQVDTHARYIYIHGTPEEGLLGTPSSHGCVRMKNTGVIELFDLVPVGTPVLIQL